MERLTARPARILAGLILVATVVLGQGYTISAKPGAINYIEGNASINGNPVSDRALKATFLGANDSFSTENGKAEVLLTPGVFLRVGENTEIRMVSPSLVDTRVELVRGEIMIEATGLVKENNLQILDHGALVTITKNGLYKFTADNPPTAAVLEGKANVSYSDRKVDLKKGRQTILASNLDVQKFDTKAEDDLYAWSNVRSQYEAAASYRLASDASLTAASNSAFGYGFGPGWYWNNGFNSYAWLPGNGAFYSPFGYGFYSPGYVGSVPVIMTPVYRGGRAINTAVPVNMQHPPATGGVQRSPWADHAARVQAARAYAAANPGAASAAAAANADGWQRGSGGGGWHGGNAPSASSGAAPAAHSWGGGGAAAGGGGHAGGGHRSQ